MRPFRFPLSIASSLSRVLNRATLAGVLACAGGLNGCGGGGGAPSALPATPPSANGPALDPAVTAALGSGDATQVPTATLQAAAMTALQAHVDDFAPVMQTLFGLDAQSHPTADTVTGLDWDPSHDSATLTLLDSGRNEVVLPSNWRYADGQPSAQAALAVAGFMPGNGARYLALGGNPLAVPGNAAMDAFMRRAVGWLTGRSNLSGLKVVVAHLPGTTTYWFPHEPAVRNWLAAQVPGVTINGVAPAQATDDSCDGDKLAACLQGADLLVIGRQQGPSGANSSTPDRYPDSYSGATIEAAVKAAQGRGLPVLFLHHHHSANDLDRRLLGLFGLGSISNYWGQEGLKGQTPPTTPGTAIPALKGLLTRLDHEGFSTTWSGCVTALGKTTCDGSDGNAGDAAYIHEFKLPTQLMADRIAGLDAQGLPLFSRDGYTLEKLFVLLGDRYRANVRYPMNKATAGVAFFRALFADAMAYSNRPSNQVATNLGNFSALFPASTPTVTRVVNVPVTANSTVAWPTGLYVLPGRPVTLTRTDAGTLPVIVNINLLRDTTRPFDTYDRPTRLASLPQMLQAGQTITLSSPYGGPLYLGTGPEAATVQVQGTTTHPVLRDMTDAAQVSAFEAELAATPTNWAVVTTDFLTLHSTVGHFRQTLAAQGNSMSQLSSLLWTYMVKDTYELAGFNSAQAGRFTLPASVQSYCTDAGWDCSGTQHRRDEVQHVISDDHALCGAGCSGNPYDQDWAIDPLGWGETHEIGHNLQRERLKVYGPLSTEVSNNIFPMHKQMAYHRDHPLATPLKRYAGSTQAAFNQLKAAAGTASPQATMTTAIWSDTSYAANNAARLNFYRQLVEFARTGNARFTDGWELYTLMYLLERNFTQVCMSGTTWSTVRDSLGMGTYAAAPCDMNGNDFMLIASSRIIGQDMRAVFSLWGVSWSPAADLQVSAYRLSPTLPVVFPMAHLNVTAAEVGTPVLVSTSATYPNGY